MSPTLRPNQIIVASGWFHSVTDGDVVVIWHDGLEKIKRVSKVDQGRGIFVIGDNPGGSTDSRSFGWIDFDKVVAKVIWPRV